MKALVAPAAFLLAMSAPVCAQVSPSTFTTGYRYDAMRRLTGTIAPDPDGTGPRGFAAVRNTYDVAGRLVRVEKGELAAWAPEAVAPANWSGFSVHTTVDTAYDALDRKVTESAISGTTTKTLTQFSYDPVGRLECTAMRMNPAIYGALPSSACTLGAEGAAGPDRITHNVYDAAGQLLAVQKAYGVTTVNGFSVTLQQDYATYTYSDNGKQTSVKDANGNLASMDYDGFDRLAKWTFPSPTTGLGQVNANDYEAYTYDANGNRLTQRRRDGRVLTFAYDALNRMTSKIVPDGCAPMQQGACPAAAATRDVYYSYDLQDHQTAARFDAFAGSEGVANTFDGFGNLISSTTAMGGISRTLGFAYDNDGNRIQVTHPDGVAFNMDYDGLDRATNQRWTINGGTTPFMAITYDAAGRRQDTHRGSSSTQYGYDGISRLASLNQSFAASAANVSQGFNYNPASQIISQTRDNDAYAYTGLANVDRPYQVNGLNQYSSAGSATFTYDANGNLITDGTGTYAYDAENRLVTVNGTSLTYDPLGRLWQIAGPSVPSVQFLYDGDKLALEYNGSGGILTRYGWGPGVDEPILADSGGQLSCSGTKFLHADWQGSIIAAADCNGNRTSVNSYNEYGIPAATNSGRFQYTGQAWLKEIGLYYYKARIYSPTLGRFLQTDPIGYEDQINLYAYVGNDPVDGRDPAGTFGILGGCQAGSSCTSTDPGASNAAAQAQRVGPRINESRGGNQRGDPGRTSKPDGSGNPDKKFKPGGKPGTRIFNDPTTGKPVTKPWPQDGRRGGDGTGVHPGSKYPDGTPVNPDGNKSRAVLGGLAVLGALACAIFEPCGAMVIVTLGLGGTTLVGTQ